MPSLGSASQPAFAVTHHTLTSSSPHSSRTVICRPCPKPCSLFAQSPSSTAYWSNLNFSRELSFSSSNLELTLVTSLFLARWVRAVTCSRAARIWVLAQRSASASAKRDFSDRPGHIPTPPVSNAHLQRSDACGGSRWLACSAPQFLVASYWPRPVGRAGLAAPSVIAFTNKSQWEGLLAHLWNVDSRTYQTS